MSTYIPLGKIPESPEERQKLLGRVVETEEYLNALELSHIQKKVIEFLISRKGYTKKNIEVNKVYTVKLTDASFDVKADIQLRIDGKILLFIKCVMSSIESWERNSISFCRVVESYQIPYAVVTDGENARMLNVISGELISEGLDTIPAKEEALKLIKDIILTAHPEKKSEKEKRILYAFNAIQCPSNTIS
ncbi:MAG: type I restriction enzyme HsdR N-terminal domain-containing protein [Thermodesulfovibrionales bacterium]|nr:type I restriction enzyme HsdR N-terminal domain-containing protein [Thermodesulfovibrionales bacterium]